MLTFKNNIEIKKSLQDTLQKIINLDFWKDTKIVHCDKQFIITKDNATEWSIDNISDTNQEMVYVDNPYLVMEFVYGKALANDLRQENKQKDNLQHAIYNYLNGASYNFIIPIDIVSRLQFQHGKGANIIDLVDFLNDVIKNIKELKYGLVDLLEEYTLADAGAQEDNQEDNTGE